MLPEPAPHIWFGKRRRVDKISPRVTIIIPCYNGKRYIGSAVKSVLDQTFNEFEIIVVDDGSSDGSIDAIAGFRSDPRLQLIVHEKNRGIAAARNTGIKNSRGDYIAFLDQDDLWKADKLEKQINIFENDRSGEIGMVFSDVELIKEVNGKTKRRRQRAPSGINTASRIEILKNLFLRNFVTIVSAMVRRRCFDDVGLLDERIRSGADDYDFCFRLAVHYRFAHIAEPLAARRVHDSNYTDVEKLFPDAMVILGREQMKTPELAGLRNTRLNDLYNQLADCLLFKGELKKARLAYKQSIKYNRSNIKGYFGMFLSSSGVFGGKLGRLWFSRRKL